MKYIQWRLVKHAYIPSGKIRVNQLWQVISSVDFGFIFYKEAKFCTESHYLKNPTKQ